MPKTLPIVRVWFVESGTFQPWRTYAVPSGWYWVEGNESRGPFDTEGEALKDAHKTHREFVFAS